MTDPTPNSTRLCLEQIAALQTQNEMTETQAESTDFPAIYDQMIALARMAVG